MNSNQLEDSTSALIELFKLQTTLQERLRKLESELQCITSANEFEKLSPVELQKNLEIAEQQLLDTQHEHANRTELSKMVLYGQEAFKSAYSETFNFNKNENGTLTSIHKKISLKLDHLKNSNKQIIEKQNKLLDLEVHYQDVKKRLLEIQSQNRALYKLLQHAQATTDLSTQRKKAEENQKTKELRENLDNSVKELRIRKEMFLSLIHASKVDWYADEQLRELVLLLGEPITLNAST